MKFKYFQKTYILFSLLFFLVHTEGVTQNPLTSAQDINILVENNITTIAGDIEGAVFAGGNIVVNGSSQITGNFSGTGNVYRNIDGANYKLIAHGSLVYTSGIFNINGNLSEKYVKIGNLNGGSILTSGSNVQIFNAGNGIQINNTAQTTDFSGTSSFNFTTAFATLRYNSTSLSTCTANVNPTIASNTFLTLGASGTQIWNITDTQLSSISAITFNNQPTASNPLIININASGSFAWNVPTMAGIGRTEGRYIIWNFYNATSLTVQGTGMCEGSILAPNADINKTSSNNVEGQIIGKSFSQSGGEVHVAHFNTNASGCAPCPIITTQPIGLTQCVNGTQVLSVTVSGSLLSYQWQSSPNNSTWTNISGATNASYTPPSTIAGTTYYRAAVTDGACGSGNSTSVAVIINALPTPSISGTNTICNGASTTLTATGGTSYAWSTGATTAAITVSPSTTTTYTVTATNAAGCTATTTRTVTVNATPSTPPIASPVNNACPSTTVNLNTISAALTPSVSGGVFEWHVSNSSGSALVSSPTAVGAGTYYLFEKSPDDCYSSGGAVTANITTCCPTPQCIPLTITKIR